MAQEPERRADNLYRALSRAIFLAAGLFLFIWFIKEALLAILFFGVAFILALALNPPVTWLEKHGIGRVWGTLLVMLGCLAVTAGVGALVVPRLAEQISTLADQAPHYINQFNRRAVAWLEHYPRLQEDVQHLVGSDHEIMKRVAPLMQTFLARVGGYTLSLVGIIILLLLLLTTVIYTLVQPRPLLKSYIHVFPPHLRDKAERAYFKSAGAVSAWLWSNVIIGTFEAIAAGIALSLLGVPGAMVWAALTFFAEIVPQVSAYLMMTPPVLVALAVDPMMALWVAIFYIVMMQLAGNVLSPIVRSAQMKLHPVSLLFSVLAMGSVFGILGALIATPMTGIFKAFYEEFFASTRPKDPQNEERVERMLERKDMEKSEEEKGE